MCVCVCERGCMSVCVPEGLAFSRSHPLQLIQPRLLDLLYSWPPFYSRRSWGGEVSGPNLHLACKPERQRHTSRETRDLHDSERETKTHDLHDCEGSVCECEQPYSDYRDGQISPAMAAQREPYLPILYTETERECVCVPLCVGEPRLIHSIH